MLGNARTRLPFPGVAALYEALRRGGDGARHNPIFYVSNSPWNIYDIIADFLDLYPALPFVLIGDNSQKDPEIYRSILDHYPGRILAIYIRNVDTHPERSASLKALAEEVLAVGSTLVLADDSYAAALHAADHGWITRESLPSVRQEEKADEGETGTKVDVPGVAEEPAAPTVVVE